MLVGCGRETAERLLVSAVEDAKDTKQAQNQLFVAYRTALHIMATFAFNDEKQLGKSFPEFLRSLTADLEHELEFLKQSGEMQFVKPSHPGEGNLT